MGAGRMVKQRNQMKTKQQYLDLSLSGETMLPFGLAARMLGLSRQRIYQAKDAGLIVTRNIYGWEMVTLASLYVWRSRSGRPVKCSAPVSLQQLAQSPARLGIKKAVCKESKTK